MIPEGCFQPSARDVRLRARQRNPRASRNTVCTWRHGGESEPQHGFFRWRLDANQALGLFVAPRQDRRLQRCTTACGSSVDAPLHIRDGWGAMRSLRAGDSAVRCFLRRSACVVDAHAHSESDATALRCSGLRHPHVGSRRAGCSAPTVNLTQGGLRDATEYLTRDPRRAAPGRRLQACRGRARLRCGRCDWQPRAGNWPLGARRRKRVACIAACVPVQVQIPAANLNEFPGPCGPG